MAVQEWLIKKPGEGGGGGAAADSAYIIPYAAVITPNCDNGNLQVCTLAGNITVNAPANRSEHRLQLVLVQDSTGWRIITFDTAFRIPVGFQPDGTPATYTTVNIFFDAAGRAWHASYPITGMPTT